MVYALVNSPAIMPIDCRMSIQFPAMNAITPLHHYTAPAVPVGQSAIWNIDFRQDQCVPRNSHDPFILATTRAKFQMQFRVCRDVYADNGKIAGLQLEDARTAAQRRSRRSIRVWVRPESPFEHAEYLTIVRCRVNFIFANLSPCRKQFRRGESLPPSHGYSKPSDCVSKFR